MCTMNTAMFSKIYGKEKQFKAAEPLCAANRGMVFKTESIWERWGGGCSKQKRSGVGGTSAVHGGSPSWKCSSSSRFWRRGATTSWHAGNKLLTPPSPKNRWWREGFGGGGRGGGGGGVVRWWVGSLGCGRGLSAFVRTVSGLNIGTFCFLYYNSHSKFRIFTYWTFFWAVFFRPTFFLWSLATICLWHVVQKSFRETSLF